MEGSGWRVVAAGIGAVEEPSSQANMPIHCSGGWTIAVSRKHLHEYLQRLNVTAADWVWWWW